MMEGSTDDGSSTPRPSPPNVERTVVNAQRVIQYWLDKSTIHIVPRWVAFTVLFLLFGLRIYIVQGYYIVAYGLGIYLLNNFIAFLSPLEDPDGPNHDDDGGNGPLLPTTNRVDEFRPFARRLPEFKFWLSCSKGVLTATAMSWCSLFDVPVFWPILLLYFFVLFFLTMKRQILHMVKHKYIPISFGKVKRQHAGKETGLYGGGMAKGR